MAQFESLHSKHNRGTLEIEPDDECLLKSLEQKHLIKCVVDSVEAVTMREKLDRKAALL